MEKVKVLLVNVNEVLEERLKRADYEVLSCSDSLLDIQRMILMNAPLVIVMREKLEYLELFRMLDKHNNGVKILLLAEDDVFSESDLYGFDFVERFTYKNDFDVISMLNMTLVNAIVNDAIELKELEEYREYVIHTALSDLGITANYTGYHYIKDILDMLSRNVIDQSDTLCKIVYPQIASSHCVTAVSVERCIRTAIGRSWSMINGKIRSKYFGLAYIDRKSAPSNREFLYVVSSSICFDIKRFKNNLKEELLRKV